jgi:hypothetical protein
MLHVALHNDKGEQNSLFYNSLRLKRFTALMPKVIAITSLYSPERRRVERFLERGFRQAYSAQIREHYPTLMSVQDHEGTILGALGFRYAQDEQLFLEQYLDIPVESALCPPFENLLSRDDIVEVGNLVSEGTGASIFLFTALTAYLAKQHKRYITVTATDFLHRYFERLGVEPRVIGYADQARLQDGGASWGNYYETRPRLLAGQIAPAYEKLQRHLQMRMVENAPQWSAQLHNKIRD